MRNTGYYEKGFWICLEKDPGLKIEIILSIQKEKMADDYKSEQSAYACDVCFLIHQTSRPKYHFSYGFLFRPKQRTVKEYWRLPNRRRWFVAHGSHRIKHFLLTNLNQIVSIAISALVHNFCGKHYRSGELY